MLGSPSAITCFRSWERDGHFATVSLCTNKVTEVRCALKVIPCSHQKHEILQREFGFIRSTCHPNVLKMIEVFAELEDEAVYLVSQLAQEGELFNCGEVEVHGQRGKATIRANFLCTRKCCKCLRNPRISWRR